MTYAALNISSKSICRLGLDPQHLENGFLYTSSLTGGGRSQTSVLKHFGSWTIWFPTTLFMEKMYCLSNKTLGLDSLPNNPFTLIPVWSVKHVSSDKPRRFRFWKKWFSMGFWNELGSRTKVPLHFPNICITTMAVGSCHDNGRWYCSKNDWTLPI